MISRLIGDNVRCTQFLKRKRITFIMQFCYSLWVLITPEQCRAARALLGWVQPNLAKRSKVSTRTIASFELAERIPSEVKLSKLQTALERAGIEFLPERAGKGVGVRLARAGRRGR